MNAKILLNKYLNTGIPIREYQFNKLNPNLRTTYIRKRSIAIISGDYVKPFEAPYISQDTFIESLKQNGRNIEFIKNQTTELQMAAVEKIPSFISYIKNPTPQVEMYVVKKIPSYIEFIKNQTTELQMYLVEKEPYYVDYIKNPTDEVQDYILKNHPYYVKYIKNPNEKIKQYKLRNNINESRKKIIINESQLKLLIKNMI